MTIMPANSSTSARYAVFSALGAEERKHRLRFSVGDGAPGRGLKPLAHLQGEQARRICIEIGDAAYRVLRRAKKALMSLERAIGVAEIFHDALEAIQRALRRPRKRAVAGARIF